jgi:hypothetical protein
MHAKRFLAGMVTGALLFLPRAPARAQECSGLALTDCRVSVRFRSTPTRFDRIAMKCTATPDPSHPLDPVRDGMTVSVANSLAGGCYEEPMMPVRSANCFVYRKTDPSTGGRITFRLCPKGAAYRVSFNASKADLQCLSGQQAVAALRSGITCGATQCNLGPPHDCTPVSTTTSSTVGPSTTTSSSTNTIVPVTTTTSSTTPPPTFQCQIECADHYSPVIGVHNIGECSAQQPCGSGNPLQYPHCGVRNRILDGALYFHGDTFCCATCGNSGGHYHQASSDNPFVVGEPDCVRRCKDLAGTYCAHHGSTSVNQFVGNCAP